MKTFKFSLVLRTRENSDVFISLDDNIYGIHSKRINILYVPAGYNRRQEHMIIRTCNVGDYSNNWYKAKSNKAIYRKNK